MRLIEIILVLLICKFQNTYTQYVDESVETLETDEDFSNTFNEKEANTRLQELTLQMHRMMLNLQDHIGRNRYVFTHIYEELEKNKLVLGRENNRFTTKVSQVEKNITRYNSIRDSRKAETNLVFNEIEEKYNNLLRKYHEVFNLMERNKKQVKIWDILQRNHIQQVEVKLNSMIHKLVSDITNPARSYRRQLTRTYDFEVPFQ